MKSNIKPPVIIIRGEVASGKSTLAAFIKEALRPYGVEIIVEDEDGPPQTMSHTSQMFLLNLGPIRIRQETVSKPSKRKERP